MQSQICSSDLFYEVLLGPGDLQHLKLREGPLEQGACLQCC